MHVLNQFSTLFSLKLSRLYHAAETVSHTLQRKNIIFKDAIDAVQTVMAYYR